MLGVDRKWLRMIENIKLCSMSEKKLQIEYLEQTPVAVIATLLRMEKCSLKKGVVRSLKHLGSFKTEFGQIGNLEPRVVTGEKKFLVYELVPLLRQNPGISDGGLLNKIEEFIKKDQGCEIEFNITVFHINGEYIIKDGNKRTIAFYERRKDSKQDNISFSVYLVEPADRLDT